MTPTGRAAVTSGPTLQASTSTAMACHRGGQSPEVLYTRNAIDEAGVDFAMDIHGDGRSALPRGFEGIRRSPSARLACSKL